MKIGPDCEKCLYDQQARRSSDEDYLAEVRGLLAARGEADSAPLMVYRFNQAYRRRFGDGESYRAVKRRYNDLVLGMADALRERIAASEDPLAASLALSRVGNYIDFGAMSAVDEDAFLALFDGACLRAEEREVYASFLRACAGARDFLLVADNCGEIVLDGLMLEQLQSRFPRLRLRVMVRGGEALNDATAEDALDVGLDRLAGIVPNGAAVAGTVYELMSPEARTALDGAGVILSKGQGNYETLSGQGRHVFYLFLCKCDLFVRRFRVPRLTGMFLEEE